MFKVITAAATAVASVNGLAVQGPEEALRERVRMLCGQTCDRDGIDVIQCIDYCNVSNIDILFLNSCSKQDTPNQFVVACQNSCMAPQLRWDERQIDNCKQTCSREAVTVYMQHCPGFFASH